MTWILKVKEEGPPEEGEGLGLLLLIGIALYALSKKEERRGYR